jgi:hypothetical protein
MPVRYESSAGVAADIEMERRVGHGLERAGEGFGSGAGLEMEIDF